MHYKHSDKKTIVLNGVNVNDGKWHYLEARWQADNSLLITLDYGQIRVSPFINYTFKTLRDHGADRTMGRATDNEHSSSKLVKHSWIR